ncbi:MFS transporter [Amycolatopsis sp. cmx-11-51]|uniref:MFS transporter n=1 Tax=Amycolatopsis sp. cmx-11-51 TaxID=2785797 RepID=UPI0039E3DDFF
MTDHGEARGWRAALAVEDFRALWIAEMVASAGEQLARVAMAVLVLARTGSGSLAGLTYALTFLPAVAGPLIAGVADRYSRRAVLVIGDLARAALAGLMAVPGLPLPLSLGLLLGLQLMAIPAKAARGAMLPDILPGDLLVTGQSVRLVTQQISQIAGFVLGGALSGIAPEAALATYAICCVGSAAVIARYVGAWSPPEATRRGYWGSSWDVVRVIWGHAGLRVLALLASLLGVTVVPEGLAAAYVAEMGGESWQAGLLMAADPAGMALGAYLLGSRLISAERRLASMGPLAAAGGLPLLVCLARPGLVVSAVMFMLAGACTAYLVVVGATFSRLVPVTSRGQCMGLFNSLLAGSTGVAVLAASALASLVGPAVSIAAAGAFIVTAGLVATVLWRRVPLSTVTEPKSTVG